MQRRSVLKLLAGSAALAAAPSCLMAKDVSLVEESAVNPAATNCIGMVREVTAYNLYSDKHLVRYDMLTKDTQHSVTVEYSGNEDDLKSSRESAIALLVNVMNEEGITAEDLIKLRDVPGYKTEFIDLWH